MEKLSPLERELDKLISFIGKSFCVALLGIFCAFIVGCWLKIVAWAYYL